MLQARQVRELAPWPSGIGLCQRLDTAGDSSSRRTDNAQDKPYIIMDNYGPNKATLDSRLLGNELASSGMHVSRCLVFSPDGVRGRYDS